MEAKERKRMLSQSNKIWDLNKVTRHKSQVVGVVNASKNVSMMSAKASEGYDLEYNNEIVKLSPSHEVFQNSPKLPHEGHLHAMFSEADK
jgi:hypothetical protein